MLGSGSIIVADDRVSIPHMALRTARFYHHESCGKCTPCREGTQLDGEDARAGRARRGDADGPRHHQLGPGATSSATASACSATRWRCRSARWCRKFRDEFEAVIAELRRGRACAARAGAPMTRERRRERREVTLIDRRPRGRPRPRAMMLARRRQARATSRSRSSVTSRSSASRSAPAACAWSRSRGSRSCRPPARRPVRDGMVVHTRDRAGQARAERGGRVPARQPPARLPGLRQGRRVPAAGHHATAGARARAA